MRMDLKNWAYQKLNQFFFLQIEDFGKEAGSLKV